MPRARIDETEGGVVSSGFVDDGGGRSPPLVEGEGGGPTDRAGENRIAAAISSAAEFADRVEDMGGDKGSAI